MKSLFLLPLLILSLKAQAQEVQVRARVTCSGSFLMQTVCEDKAYEKAQKLCQKNGGFEVEVQDCGSSRERNYVSGEQTYQSSCTIICQLE